MNPYKRVIIEVREILSSLIKRMCIEEDTKIFRNIAAVYIIWQHELHLLECEGIKYER